MRIVKSETTNDPIIHSVKQNSIVERVSRIGKSALQYFVRNKYALEMSLWSYALIQFSIVASESIVPGDYVYDINSCRKKLCNYTNQYTHPNQTEDQLFNLIDSCDSSIPQVGYSYSFIDCLDDLCTYLATIGEKYYACIDLSKGTNNKLHRQSVIEFKTSEVIFWNKVCPKRHFNNLTGLRKLTYFKDCLRSICTKRDVVNILSEEMKELCNTTSLEDLHLTLNSIKRNIHKLTKLIETEAIENSWDKTNALTNVVVALTSTVSSAAAIGATLIAYRSESRVAIALEQGSESVNIALRNLNRNTKSSVRSFTQQVINILSNSVPGNVLAPLRELSEAMYEEGSVYYSASDGSVSVKAGNPDVPGNAILDTIGKGVIAGNIPGTMVVRDVGGKLFELRPLPIKEIIKTVKQITNIPSLVETTTESIYSTIQDREEVSITNIFRSFPDDYCIKHYVSYTGRPNRILSLWIDCLKEILPTWDNSYCFYSRADNFLSCKLPIDRDKKERVISFFFIKLHKFFSENTETLCHIFNEGLWCNWNKFLDLAFSQRSISFFYDEQCPWDEFLLKVFQSAPNIYEIEAIGGCYNQTALIKV